MKKQTLSSFTMDKKIHFDLIIERDGSVLAFDDFFGYRRMPLIVCKDEKRYSLWTASFLNGSPTKKDEVIRSRHKKIIVSFLLSYAERIL